MQTYEHPLSWQAIGRIVTTILIIFFIWKTFGILVLILVSAMLATALYPLVKKLNQKVSLFVSTLVVVLLLLVPFIILAATIIPSLINEFPSLLKTLDIIVSKSSILPPAIKNIDFAQYAQNAGVYLLQSTTIITSVATSILTLLFLTFYLIYDSKRLIVLALSIFPRNRRKKISLLFTELGEVNGQYIRGNLIISVICGLTIYVGLLLLNIPYAAPLAIFAAIMDLLPLIGSTIGMIPALIIGFAISPVTLLLVAALYLIYQQIENAFLGPAIYNKALNLSPALGFLAVIIGGALFNIVGAFLALPVAASLPAIIKYIREETEGNLSEKGLSEKDWH
ncbi:hypothetical protein BH09PAT2_BH09PAT2_06030 [soil metagenome]